jgi:hypothetical protein
MGFNKNYEMYSLAKAKENLARMQYQLGVQTQDRKHFNEASKLRREKHAIIRSIR